jgi:isocitrate dehydrogenase (NAD+)
VHRIYRQSAELHSQESGGGFDEPLIDTTVFRQGTEGMYAGIEWTNPPENVRAALNTHAKFKAFANVAGPDLAVSCRVITRNAAHRICTAAFEYAKKRGFKGVTICEKPNVVRETSGMMEEVAKEVAKNYPGIALWSTNIDAQLMWLNKNPEEYNVIVASNLFGDILSDAFAGLMGGLGFAASGNIGDDVAVFEPTHGSAPKYAELDPPIVNPIAMILSAAMLLDHAMRPEGGAHAQGNCRRRARRQSPHIRYDAHSGRSEIDHPGRGFNRANDGCNSGKAEIVES